MYLKVFHTHNRYIAVGEPSNFWEGDSNIYIPEWYYDEGRDVIFEMTNYIKFNKEFKEISMWHRIVATDTSMELKAKYVFEKPIPQFVLNDAILNKLNPPKYGTHPHVLVGIDVEMDWRKDIRNLHKRSFVIVTEGKLGVIDYFSKPK